MTYQMMYYPSHRCLHLHFQFIFIFYFIFLGNLRHPGGGVWYPVRGQTEHSFVNRGCSSSSWESASRGIWGARGGVAKRRKRSFLACFPGMFPPRGRETQLPHAIPPSLECFSAIRGGLSGKAKTFSTAFGTSKPPRPAAGVI